MLFGRANTLALIYGIRSKHQANHLLPVCTHSVVCTETKRVNSVCMYSVLSSDFLKISCQLILFFLESKLLISSSSRVSIIHRPSMQDEKSNLKVGASDPNRVMMTQKPTRFNDATRSLSRSAMVIINVAWIVMLSS